MQDKLAYRLIRSRRKTISMEVQPGGDVVVRAPLRAPLSQVEAFVQSRAAWANKYRARMLSRPPVKEYSEEEIARLRQKAREVLSQRVAYYAPLMGARPAGITITRARTRYSSCSAKGRVAFSCFLMLSPPEAIDYVVVHELCHLKQMNHGPRFYALLENALPDWKQRKAALTPLR